MIRKAYADITKRLDARLIQGMTGAGSCQFGRLGRHHRINGDCAMTRRIMVFPPYIGKTAPKSNIIRPGTSPASVDIPRFSGFSHTLTLSLKESSLASGIFDQALSVKYSFFAFPTVYKRCMPLPVFRRRALNIVKLY